MFPVTDFNLVVCGIATFAATVGYACTRRLASDPLAISNNNPDLLESIIIPPASSRQAALRPTATEAKKVEPQSPSELDDSEDMSTFDEASSPSALGRRPSLKRKRPHEDQEDENVGVGYPHNLTSIYPPKKRSRTPSSEGSSAKVIAETEGVHQPVVVPAPSNDKDTIKSDVEAPKPTDEAPLPTPPATPAFVPPGNECSRTPSPVFGSPIKMSMPPKTPLSRASTSNAFSAFVGSASPFATTRPSPNTPLGHNKPAWMIADEDTPMASLTGLPEKGLSTLTNNPVTEIQKNVAQRRHVLAAAVASKTTYEHLTGEEDEDLELELKGVKLYVKRGDKPFSDGVLGHIKLLSNKSTLDERLLFRREPVWQVSMNVRMHPTVKCTFDAEENVLRLILKEFVEQTNVPQKDWKGEVVIYALKPGRSCAKQDFKDFASSLVESVGLKSH